MKGIVFVKEKFPHRLHTLIASLNMDADLMFNDGERYLVTGGDNGREVNNYLLVRAKHKSCLLGLLGQAFNGVSNTCGEGTDARLFYMLERMARSGHWKSLDEIESWLTDRGVSFTKQKLTEINWD